MIIPSAEELARASMLFDQEWGGVDEVLYELCRSRPDHADLRTTTAKLAIVSRAYSAGLERRVCPPPGRQAISVVAEYVHDHRREVDAAVTEALALQEPLTAETTRRLVELHGRFTRLLVGVTTDKKAPRSFASKYLHFHNPVVPIYDSYAAAGIIKRVRWDSTVVTFSCPEGGDAEYYQFCVRFWRLYDACRRQGVDVTVKSLDTVLWAVPTAG
jgi:hypothetical protein